MNFRKYIELARNSFSQAMAYRLDALNVFLSSLVFLVLYYAVWSSIAESGQLEGGLNQVMTYIVVGQVISNTVFNQTEKFVGQKIRKGTIVNELKRPVSLFSQMYFHDLGQSIFNLISKAIPLMFISFLFIEISFPGPVNTLGFFVSLFLSFNLVFLLGFITSMLVFWTKVEWSIRMMRNTLQNLFSGVLFPLYLLPTELGRIFNLLPFKSMVDTPIQIFTMQVTTVDIIPLLFKQVVWIILLFLISKFAWRKAKKKLTVQGG